MEKRERSLCNCYSANIHLNTRKEYVEGCVRSTKGSKAVIGFYKHYQKKHE